MVGGGERAGAALLGGAVDFRGTRAGKATVGRGYLEMTGHAGRAMSGWFGGKGSRGLIRGWGWGMDGACFKPLLCFVYVKKTCCSDHS